MSVSALKKLELLAKTKNQKADILGNNLTSVLKLLIGSAISLSLLPPQSSYAQDQSLQSFKAVNTNLPERFIRHRNFLGFVDQVGEKDCLARNDATFRLVSPGLAGDCTSFESFNFPGYFLRHQDFRLKLAKQTNDQLFKEDATFCFEDGLFSGIGPHSFRSFNKPHYYIRHSNFELWLAENDGSPLFKKDTEFLVAPPLSVSFSSQQANPHGNPVPND